MENKKFQIGQIREYYSNRENVLEYDEKRFKNRGGKFIDQWEKKIVSDLLVDHPKNRPILEVAAGTGRFSLMLAKMGYSIIVIDSSNEMLLQIKREAEVQDLNILCVQGDAFNLPFSSQAFHSVISIRFVWHFSNYVDLVSELARVARRNLIFDHMNIYSVGFITAYLANKVFYRTLHTQLSTKRKIERLIKSLGLETLAWKQAFFWPYIFYRRLPLLTPILSEIDKFITNKIGLGSVMYWRVKVQSPENNRPDNQA